AAFVMTALSRARAFAEIVPAELVERTVSLAGEQGPPSSPTDRTSPHDQPSVRVSVPERIESLAEIGRRVPEFAHLVFVLLLSVLSVSAAIGISLALSKSGNSSYLETAFTAFLRGRATGSSCH